MKLHLPVGCKGQRKRSGTIFVMQMLMCYIMSEEHLPTRGYVVTPHDVWSVLALQDWMTLKWAYLALSCQILVLRQVSGLHSTATRQPTSTNLRKIHAGRAGRAALFILHHVSLASP